MTVNAAARVPKHRARLRASGLRPVQIWVPDTRRPDFADECRRQARLASAAEKADEELSGFVDAALVDVDGWSARDAGIPRSSLCKAILASDGRHRWCNDQFDELATVTVLLASGTLVDAPLLRVTLVPDEKNGLRKPSQVMIDKAMTIKRDKFGAANDETMLKVGRGLAVFLGVV